MRNAIRVRIDLEIQFFTEVPVMFPTVRCCRHVDLGPSVWTTWLSTTTCSAAHGVTACAFVSFFFLSCVAKSTQFFFPVLPCQSFHLTLCSCFVDTVGLINQSFNQSVLTPMMRFVSSLMMLLSFASRSNCQLPADASTNAIFLPLICRLTLDVALALALVPMACVALVPVVILHCLCCGLVALTHKKASGFCRPWCWSCSVPLLQPLLSHESFCHSTLSMCLALLLLSAVGFSALAWQSRSCCCLSSWLVF